MKNEKISKDDKAAQKFMRAALAEARKAFDADEVPVGCVMVRDGKILARAHNKREAEGDATAHAEILCIQKACKKTGNFRLNGCDMYVTLEPCPMCAGAIINARIGRVFFGAFDEKAGCCGTLYNLPSDKRFNHNAAVEGGVLEGECGQVLKEFFSLKRKK
jgi:tRNA(adenine34) deaminase